MNKEDTSSIKFLKKRKRKDPNFRFFVASKKGSNERGKGVYRSVILASDDGKTWFQSIKIWGHGNEERANEIVRLSNI